MTTDEARHIIVVELRALAEEPQGSAASERFETTDRTAAWTRARELRERVEALGGTLYLEADTCWIYQHPPGAGLFVVVSILTTHV